MKKDELRKGKNIKRRLRERNTAPAASKSRPVGSGMKIVSMLR